MIEHPLVTACNLGKTLLKLNFTDENKPLVSPSEKYFIGKKVIIVGSNPGKESPDNTAFHPETKSGKTVRSWFDEELVYVHFMNLHHVKCDIKELPKSSPDEMNILQQQFIFHTSYNYKIIACGDYVSKQLELINVRHFKMPHPSGLNRFWNDKDAGKAKIAEMLKWVKDGK